ncbi:MAG: riboflavin synthase [Opitutaceae bacterium]|jgi:riboflavin synthase|nr:riboflavin synthase [Opitutaceae bacterium]
MFTGIIEETGAVASFTRGGDAWKLRVAAQTTLEGTRPGDSIAVNGCCLTVTETGASSLSFDVLEQSRRLTSLSAIAPDRPFPLVNLERALRFNGKMGGHFVTGHIDGLGVIETLEPRGADHYLRVRVPGGCAHPLVPKGSIAIDGISLTLAEVFENAFACWLIPTTLRLTNLREKRPGDPVNLEFDLLGKYVEKLLVREKPDAAERKQE